MWNHGYSHEEREQGRPGKKRINAVKEDCRQWSLNIRQAVDRIQHRIGLYTYLRAHLRRHGNNSQVNAVQYVLQLDLSTILVSYSTEFSRDVMSDPHKVACTWMASGHWSRRWMDDAVEQTRWQVQWLILTCTEVSWTRLYTATHNDNDTRLTAIFQIG